MLIYFLISDFPNVYDDGIIYLAEGLKELNISFYSNKDYWKINTDGDFLFNNKPEISPQDCDLVILSNMWTQYIDNTTFKEYAQPLPGWLFQPSRQYTTVYIDNMDGYKTFSYYEAARQFDIILRPKKNSRTFNYPNIYPWVLGYQNRIIKERLDIPVEKKEFAIAVNFYFSHHFIHQLRALAEKKILSAIKPELLNRVITGKDAPNNAYSNLMWTQTSKLHNPAYYNNLEKTLMVAAFCGEMIPALPPDPSVYLAGGNKARIKKHLFTFLSCFTKIPERIIQWDSWRFWETLALRSVPIHIDIEKYGGELPVMPQNWVHYIGIDLENIKRDTERILEDKKAVYNIAFEGNKWAMENYSAKASARRLINMLDSQY